MGFTEKSELLSCYLELYLQQRGGQKVQQKRISFCHKAKMKISLEMAERQSVCLMYMTFEHVCAHINSYTSFTRLPVICHHPRAQKRFQTDSTTNL